MDVITIISSLSLMGIMGFLVAYYAFPPNISIEETKDKIDQNLESRFVIKNIGKLPADKIIYDVLNLDLNNGQLTDNSAHNCGKAVFRLGSGEKTEMPVLPHFGTLFGSVAQSCSYTLAVNYEIPFPFYRPKLTKKWLVKLVVNKDSYAWQAELT